MSSTATLRKAAVTNSKEETVTANLLDYEPSMQDWNQQRTFEEDYVEASTTQRAWVLKYGGSSVGQRLPRVCESIFEHVVATTRTLPPVQHEGLRVCVVVSAMGKTTDMLLDAAQAAQEGKLDVARGFIEKIRDLSVNNAKVTLAHFKVDASKTLQVIDDLVVSAGAMLQGLDDYLKGVSLLGDLSPRTLDAILSNGERISAHVIAAVLEAVVQHPHDGTDGPSTLAASASKVLGAQLKPICVEATSFMVTDSNFGQARVDFNATRTSLRQLAKGWPTGTLPVFTGFIGRARDSGAVTTLGRNGSDYSAALIAAALKAEQVIINTDVPGVFTADPRLVPDAFPVPQMSYTEAIELSIYGSKIFHPKTMLPLMKHGVPMVIRNTSDAPGAPSTLIKDASGSFPKDSPFRPAPRPLGGALRSPSMQFVHRWSEHSSPSLRATVDARAADADVGAVCIASLEDLSFITVRAQIREDTGATGSSEVAGRAMQALEQDGVRGIWSDQRSGNDASILVRRADRERAAGVLKKEFSGFRLMELSATEPVTLLSLVPKEGAERVVAAARFFTCLAKANVKIHRVVCGASTASISCLIDAQETELAVRTAHEAFNFSRHVVSLVILGNNRTARGLLEKMQKMRAEGEQQVDIRICAVITNRGPLRGSNAGIDPKAVHLEAAGLPLNELLLRMNEEDSNAHAAPEWSPSQVYSLIESDVLPALRRLTFPVIVDCSRLSVLVPGSSIDCGALALARCYLQCLQLGIRLAVTNSATLNLFAATLPHCHHVQPCYGMTPDGSPPVSLGDPVALLQLRRGLLRYDSATAAGLPLLQTIRDQLQAGRRVSAVQGTFSATLGLILDRVTRGNATLREAAEEAHSLGICEPLITLDLGGYDTVEKLRVVAFALGCELPEECVNLRPLIPLPALEAHGLKGKGATPEDVFKALEAFDRAESFAERASKAFREGRRWRFVAILELHSSGPSPVSSPDASSGSHKRSISGPRASASIGLEEVTEEHFAFANSGQEVACALYEDLADTTSPPLVLRGQGAGRAAGEGALSDVIRLVGLV